MGIIHLKPEKLFFTSSLLIPEKHVWILSKNLQKFGGTRYFVSVLLKKYRANKKIHPLHFRSRIIFQEENQNLVKVNFRPYEQDWQLLKMISWVEGKSIALLFVEMMLLYEKNGREGKEGVPTKKYTFSIFQEIHISQITKIIRKIKIRT